ncbi:MAG: hypothetical protein IJ600_04305 [Lachnospiraceae bacterium]|nr:hypothetical protein [Lachnospiraceae bacterium]
MASVNGTSAYQQINYTIKGRSMGSDRAGASDAHKAEREPSVKEESTKLFVQQCGKQGYDRYRTRDRITF